MKSCISAAALPQPLMVIMQTARDGITEPPWFSMPSGNIISLPKLLETFQSVIPMPMMMPTAKIGVSRLAIKTCHQTTPKSQVTMQMQNVMATK